MSEVISPVLCTTCRIGKVSLYRKITSNDRQCYASTCLNCRNTVIGKEKNQVYFPADFKIYFNQLPLVDSGRLTPQQTQQPPKPSQTIAKTYHNFGNLRALLRRLAEQPDHILEELTKQPGEYPRVETENSYDLKAATYEIPNPDE